MTIGRRIGITATVLILSVLLTGAMLFWSSHLVADGIKQAEVNSRIVRSAFMLRTLMDEYLIDGDKRPLRQWNRHREIIDQILNSKETFHSVDPILIEDLKTKSRKVDSLSRQAVQLRASDDGEAHNQNLEAKRKITSELLYRSLEELAKAADDLSVAVLHDTLNKRTFVQGIILATGLSMGIIILINIYLIRKSVVRPLRVLSIGAERIGAGNFNGVAEIESDDEVGKLSHAFNTMVERLGQRDMALTKARDELELNLKEREITIDFLRLVNESRGTSNLIQGAAKFFQQRSGCEAVGIRLHEGDDYPYFEATGFPEEFVRLENHLCDYDENGRACLDSHGDPVLACMCGNVICGSFDPSQPFFTERGSFWSNCTTELLATTTEQDRQARTRNRCNGEGYESVALVPLRTGEERWGLLQLNDKRKGRFTPESIALWERLAQYLAGALAKCEAEKELRQSEARLKESQAMAHLGSWELDVANNRLTWSDEVYRIFGLQSQEFKATYEAFLKAVHPDDRKAVDEAYSGSLRDGIDTYEIEHRLVRKSTGEVRIVQEKCEHIRDGSGSIIRSVGMVHDITERKQAEEALQKAHGELELRVQERTAELEKAKQAVTVERQRLYDVLETLPVYVCLLDSDYRMPFANRYFRETFAEPLGRRCHDFLFNLTEPCEICETYTVMKTREPRHWYWTGPNGRDYDIYDFPFFEADGSMLILEMGIDITERKKAEAGLQQTMADLIRSNADLQQFAYVASHDLQEPLRNVTSCLQLLEKKYKNNLDAQADQYIHYAVESSVRMKALILDLLAYSRVGTKGKPPKQTDCEQIFDQTVKNLRSAISEAGAVITRDPLPTILADDAQLSQVFQNLIGNGIKFRREQPAQVHVSAVKNNKEWIFSVRDNGIGIESRHLDRIFVIFQRLHKRGRYEGTGIGLAIVKKVVERHNGRIWVESELGIGTTFYFTIPEKGTQT